LSTRCGFSDLHGPHHDAQKSSNTYLPRNELNKMVSPLGLGSAISGAGNPIPTTAFIFLRFLIVVYTLLVENEVFLLLPI